MTTSTRVNQTPGPRPHSASPTPSVGSQPRRGVPMPVVVGGAAVVGLLTSAALAAAPVVPVTESALTGAVLCGFATGWTALVGLSTWFTAQPQRWAAVPAAVLGASGIALLALGASAHPAVDWVWPLVVLGLAVWMTVHIRRDMGSRVGRWLLFPVIGAMGVAAVGGAYQTVGTAMDASPAMAGRLVDVGGHRLHLSCKGSGSPTVVVEPGGGAMGAHLGWVTSAVGRETTVCTYDRAGRGWSEAADGPQDALAISRDLHTLLHRAGVPGPYVMAGHSFGGLYAMTFAASHPDEVAGLVLIDATSPVYGTDGAGSAGTMPARSDDGVGRVAALVSSMARLGLGRVYAIVNASDLPAPEQAQVRARYATPAAVRNVIEEYARASASTKEAASLRDLGDTPLMVLTAEIGSDPDWPQKQDHLATLSSDSVHRVVQGADHAGMVGDQAHAVTTGRAILEVVSAIRTGQPLTR
ncbi:alpha/beta hydrolase [Oryzobacter telluris]|uniref:alpha/beta hydrolase n=1 Tax=Oryzobacter telluris TaxID=3149179 RepID=UPI00370D8C67